MMNVDPITEERCAELLQWFRDRITSAREPQELRKVLKLLEGAETAAWHYREALCSEIYAMSKPGIQRAEPLAIYQFVAATADRVISMVPRASRIRNRPQKKEGEE